MVSAVAPISTRRIPLAALSEHEGGGLETFPVTVLPAPGFQLPEMHVLLHPTPQSKHAVISSNLDDVVAQHTAAPLAVAGWRRPSACPELRSEAGLFSALF